MHPEKIWIVLIILAAVLIGANLLMFAMARGMRGIKGNVFKNFGDAAQPWKKEDEGLRELNQRVQALKAHQEDTNKSDPEI